MFTFKLGENVPVGSSVLVGGKWKPVEGKSETWVVLSDGTSLNFGDPISGWKSGK